MGGLKGGGAPGRRPRGEGGSFPELVSLVGWGRGGR